MIGYGVNTQFLRRLLMKELLIGFGVHQKFFFRNFIFYSRTLNQRSPYRRVSWNRLSQLTFGASHQGVALQLASSKTISLEELIDFSKRTLKSDYSGFRRITDPHNVGAIIRSAKHLIAKVSSFLKEDPLA